MTFQRFTVGLLFSLLLAVTAACSAETAKTAPDCALTTLDNKQQFTLRSRQGKVLYVDFWASWCPPCLKSFPFLIGLQRDFKDRGVEVIAVNMDEDIDEAKAFLAKQAINFPVVTNANEQCATDFGVPAMPTSYLIDRKGHIRHRQVGFGEDAAQEMRVLVEQLLKEP